MTQDEALKLALEALQKIYIAPEHEEYIRVWWPACEQAITAIKEALAQEQEHFALKHRIAELEGAVIGLQAQLAQPEQDSVAMSDYMALMEKYAFLKAQRKPLTVDEVWQNDELMALNAELGCGMDLLMEVVEAIEAAHGIKE